MFVTLFASWTTKGEKSVSQWQTHSFQSVFSEKAKLRGRCGFAGKLDNETENELPVPMRTLQACQISRVYRESLGFSICHMVSRPIDQISRYIESNFTVSSLAVWNDTSIPADAQVLCTIRATINVAFTHQERSRRLLTIKPQNLNSTWVESTIRLFPCCDQVEGGWGLQRCRGLRVTGIEYTAHGWYSKFYRLLAALEELSSSYSTSDKES